MNEVSFFSLLSKWEIFFLFFLSPGGRISSFSFFPLPWWERIKVRGIFLNFLRLLYWEQLTGIWILSLTLIPTFSHQGKKNFEKSRWKVFVDMRHPVPSLLEGMSISSFNIFSPLNWERLFSWVSHYQSSSILNFFIRLTTHDSLLMAHCFEGWGWHVVRQKHWVSQNIKVNLKTPQLLRKGYGSVPNHLVILAVDITTGGIAKKSTSGRMANFLKFN